MQIHFSYLERRLCGLSGFTPILSEMGGNQHKLHYAFPIEFVRQELSIILISFLFLIVSFTQAQLPFIPDNSIELKKDGELMKNPWAGGFNSPQFSVIDLNDDGKKDLVSFERGYFGVFKAFLNQGTNVVIDYKYAPEYLYKFPHLQNWALLVDYNCDGHEDIFTSVPGGIRVYRNDFMAESGNHFTLVSPILPAEGLDGQEPIYVSPPDLPAIYDVDGDGDLDILSFEVLGNTVAYFKNMSMEKFGNCDHLEYELKNTCWGYFKEDATNNAIDLFDTCDVNVIDPEKSGKHAGSTLLAFDQNSDGVTDLLIGDISYNTLTFLNNGGTTNASSMTYVLNNYPINTTAVNMTVFPAAYMLDVNNDGVKDLLVSPNNPNTSENHNNIWYYKNTHLTNAPDFEFQQTDFLQNGMVDLGEGAYATFFDENNDGLLDVMIGNRGYFVEAGVFNSQIALLRNTGATVAPAFEWVTDDYAGFSQLGMNGIYPAYGDMDNDGDQDMITGDEDGLLHYFRNDAAAGEPADFKLTQPNFKGIDVGQSAKPQIIDINRDGKPDLLVGERSGNVNYFENIGTAQNADFSSVPTSEPFGGVDIQPECCTGFSAPFMVEDSVGNYMMYVGSEQGKIYLYNDIENNLDGTFNLVDSLYVHGMNVNPSVQEINGDGKLEMVVGEYAGGLSFWKFGIPSGLGYQEHTISEFTLQVAPNPASDYLRIRHQELKIQRNFSTQLYNSLGNQFNDLDLIKSGEELILDTSGFPKGIYIINIQQGNKMFTSKFVIR
ncbi:MAG: T9SS type A sorting domain-containing protein [Bacteroidales bacterium]|nr:T9SS type A sorting domain-containing protein [Bacteroidales bacterium]